MTTFSFIVPGKPRGKGRPRTGRNFATGRPIHYTDEKTVAYEKQIANYFLFHGGRKTLRPVEVAIIACYVRPKSCKETIKTTKPDIDNIVKAVLDGLNSIAYTDDSAVVKISATKQYSDSDRLVVVIKEL